MDPDSPEPRPTIDAMRRSPIAISLALALTAAACGSTADAPELTGNTLTPAEQAEVTENVERNTGVRPAVSPGGVDRGIVEVDGTSIDYFTITPEGFAEGDTAPVVLAMPPGSQSVSTTESVVNSVYRTEALARGWVVVSPAAPGGQRFFDGSEDLVPGFLDWVEGWVTPEGGRPHLIGVSNGGLSAFRLAAQQTDAYESIIVFPGFPRSADTDALPELTDMPIRMFVGELDTSWVGPMDATRQTLEDLGGDVELQILPNENHIIQGLQDGRILFELLDGFR